MLWYERYPPRQFRLTTLLAFVTSMGVALGLLTWLERFPPVAVPSLGITLFWYGAGMLWAASLGLSRNRLFAALGTGATLVGLLFAIVYPLMLATVWGLYLLFSAIFR
jgi:hypothetical protein